MAHWTRASDRLRKFLEAAGNPADLRLESNLSPLLLGRGLFHWLDLLCRGIDYIHLHGQVALGQGLEGRQVLVEEFFISRVHHDEIDALLFDEVGADLVVAPLVPGKLIEDGLAAAVGFQGLEPGALVVGTLALFMETLNGV